MEDHTPPVTYDAEHSSIDEGHAPVNLFLKILIPAVALFSLVYLVVYFSGDPISGKALERQREAVEKPAPAPE